MMPELRPFALATGVSPLTKENKKMNALAKRNGNPEADDVS
jgi:hypothetical protein